MTNLDRLKSNTSKGKLLLNLEVELGFECLITQPTRFSTTQGNKKKCRNEATSQRSLVIKEHWRKKVDDLKENPRDFLKTFRPFLSTMGHKGEIEIHLRTDGNVVEKDQSRVADLFADYFAMIADGIAGDKSKLDSPEDFQDHPSVAAIANNIRNKQQYDIEPISNAHVERTLEKLNERKATGYDGISPKIMKIGAAQLSSLLAILFYSCMNNRKWPSQCKRGEWIPSFKNDDTQEINNYRPITVLPCVDKVLEQLTNLRASSPIGNQHIENNVAVKLPLLVLLKIGKSQKMKACPSAI